MTTATTRRTRYFTVRLSINAESFAAQIVYHGITGADADEATAKAVGYAEQAHHILGWVLDGPAEEES